MASIGSLVSPPHQPDLWTLALNRPQIDPLDLALALERECIICPLDSRTRVLIRDSLAALREHWGADRFEKWLSESPVGDQIRATASSAEGPVGFSLLRSRIMSATRPDTILEFLEELGLAMSRPERIVIGGACSLILTILVSRRTEVIDLVDEVPAQIRSNHSLMQSLGRRYGIRLAHFQSHYLPGGWESRVKHLGHFGQLDVSVVDVADVWLSKLFSARTKDRDDVRMMTPQLDKTALIERLKTDCASLLCEADLRQYAADNWYILFGESLPVL